MQTEPGKHLIMVAADSCHLSDHVTDRCGVAEERAALRSDVAVQPVKSEATVREDRCYCVVGVHGCEGQSEWDALAGFAFDVGRA